MRVLLVLLPAILMAQSAPSNLSFEKGTPGEPPPGWVVPPVLQSLGYSAELRREGCQGPSGCAVLLAPSALPPEASGNLEQSFDATPFRGKAVRLRAFIRVETSDSNDAVASAADPARKAGPGNTPVSRLPARGAQDRARVAPRSPAASADRAQMYLRVDLPNNQMGFDDDMGDRPITSSQWAAYEITGTVAAQAERIHIGVQSFGRSAVWIDGVTFEIVPDGASSPDLAETRVTLEKLYARIDAAYTQKDMDAVASLALSDAEIHLGATRLPLNSALLGIMAEMEKGVGYISRSTVTDVRLSGPDAIVSVNNEATRTVAGSTQVLITASRDMWVKSGGGWKLKQSDVISTRSVTPPTDAAASQPVLAELKQRAVPLTTAQPGSPRGDLAAFGKAVGDARIVALGEASHGMREFAQLKHRLLEYLVNQKGFTVFALEANWPESLALDRYIKTGEGSAKAALAGTYFWAWNTQEMLALVEWMRGYNQAPGQHPTLSFTSFDMQVSRVAARMALDYLGKYSLEDVETAADTYTAAQMLETRRAQVYDDQAKALADRAAAIVHVFDVKRTAMVAASSAEAWRDARQAASVVFQSCTTRIPGKGPAYRDEAMAANVDWLRQAYPNQKIVIWAHNSHVGFRAGSMGSSLRNRYGKEMYVLGFAFRSGQVRAIGLEKGKATTLAVHRVPPSPEGSGDAILSAAGMPLLFLDMAGVAAGTPLGQWLAAPHLFHNFGVVWVMDNPEANLEAQSLSKLYDGLIFVNEGHPPSPVEK